MAAVVSLSVNFDPGLANSGRILTGLVESDQFWRLLPIPTADPHTQVGVQAYKGDGEVEGISEVEIY